jgi:hypothetical protein
MNWDAIRAAALIVIAAFSAIAIGIQTVLKVQDRDRDKILEEVQEVLTPTIHLLKEEIEAIAHNKIKWIRYPTEMCCFEGYPSKLLCTDIKTCSGAERDVFSKFSDLNSRFSSHDTLYDKLYAAYVMIEREVKTTELKERLKVLVKAFNESREGVYRLTGVPFEKPDIIFGNFIINCEYQTEQKINYSLPSTDFWEEHRDGLLEFRDTPPIKELDKEIEGFLRQLKELDEALLEKLEKIREEYRVKYNFTKYEIDPELKKLENPLGIDSI